MSQKRLSSTQFAELTHLMKEDKNRLTGLSLKDVADRYAAHFDGRVSKAHVSKAAKLLDINLRNLRGKPGGILSLRTDVANLIKRVEALEAAN